MSEQRSEQVLLRSFVAPCDVFGQPMDDPAHVFAVMSSEDFEIVGAPEPLCVICRQSTFDVRRKNVLACGSAKHPLPTSAKTRKITPDSSVDINWGG